MAVTEASSSAAAADRVTITGAESLLKTLVENQVDTCFANPGTSEMHLVAALDHNPGMRCILGLFEGVCTGAADGYGRMRGTPAATLLHLGPGLANGLSNLHNALRAQSPIVNIVGDHATRHRALDAPLTSDIEGTARPFSHWIRTSQTAASLAADAVAAIAAARSAPGQIATLITPADAAWGKVEALDQTNRAKEYIASPSRPSDSKIEAAARALSEAGPAAILLNGTALLPAGLDLAGRIAAATGARLLFPTHAARVSRGAGRVPVDRISYGVSQATAELGDLATVVLVGAKPPVAFFAYPSLPGRLYSPRTKFVELTSAAEDSTYALEALASLIANKSASPVRSELLLPPRPTGPVTPAHLGTLLASMIPENAIVVDESITTGRNFVAATRQARPHDWLLGTGGSIGFALPVAIGAAVACPDRPVIALESDGSGMYMPQSLWTMARESLNVVTLVFANRKYQILRAEVANMGLQALGSRAAPLLDIGSPDLNWVALATSMGVPAQRAASMEAVADALERALAAGGPQLIEVVM